MNSYGTSIWIPNQLGISKNMRRNILYFRKMALATPKWVDYDKICVICKESKERRKNGELVNVDHIVPLNHNYVCGLHCEDNLQIITEKENERKNNHYWPDQWHEQFELEL